MAHETEYTIEGEVQLFPQDGGWHYVAIPAWITEELAGLADRGVVAVRATVGQTTWDTSLLPKGDGSHFVALNTRVRQANGLDIGDAVSLRFSIRHRGQSQ